MPPKAAKGGGKRRTGASAAGDEMPDPDDASAEHTLPLEDVQEGYIYMQAWTQELRAHGLARAEEQREKLPPQAAKQLLFAKTHALLELKNAQHKAGPGARAQPPPRLVHACMTDLVSARGRRTVS